MNKEIEDKVKELSRRIVGTGQIVVTAESLTGGMISAALTSIPGASEWFERGFVTYTNQAKHEMLDVPQSILDRFSAVSTQTVSQTKWPKWAVMNLKAIARACASRLLLSPSKV